MSSIPEILFRDVTKRFRATDPPVLQGIDLVIERGEFVTLLGPSGCGKSTMLKLVAGLEPITSGQIQVNGLEPRNARRLVSFVFQEATLLPWRNVERNVALALELEARSREDALQTRLLLMDEPFAALDEINRDRMNEEILRLREAGNWTVLFVTHSVAEAVFLSSRVVILSPHPGRIAHTISVDLPYPRTANLRESIEFDTIVNQASRLLREAHRA
jgi:NitT/TauT family transport system ATP-binding protein